MTTAQVVETSVTVNNNSPIQDYVHPDDQTQPFKNNIISYNVSSSHIDHFKKTAIPLLDSLIIQMQGRFSDKMATPAICFVSYHRS